MHSNTKIDIVQLIDGSPIGTFQWTVLILCGICMVLDGFDVQAMGYVAPALLQEWGLDKASLGPVFGAGLFGLLLGSLIFSVLSDKIGRRPVLIAATLFFGVCMLITPLSRTLQQLMIIRFITGLGLGAIMPNAMALCGEFSPQRRRIFIMMLISCGFTVGAMLGGLIAALLIPAFGWQSVFYLGGALPLLLGMTMLRYLPESIQFQVLTSADPARMAPLLRRLLPDRQIPTHAQFVIREAKTGGAPVIELFRGGRSRGTLTLWAMSFMNLLALYFLANWLPTIAKEVGLSLEQAVLVGATLQLGGTVGTLAMGWLIDRAGFKRILLPCFIVAACSIALIGHSVASLALLFAVVFIAGFTVVGGQPAINAMAASYYPTSLRTTGVGWCLGIGRIGSVIGPVLGGELIRLHWSQSILFQAFALPSVAIVLILIYGAVTARHTATVSAPG
ncbi:MFS transporter [Neisseriaceae bacterium TC5R-5]|nr:MFS transporter [Neisseriaceae bacterium TC5R-5]